MAYLELSRRVGTMDLWEQTDWTQPGLPDRNFRISLRGGMEEYRPQPIDPSQQALRQRMMGLLTARPLASGLAEIGRRTREPPNFEFSGYILGNGTIPRIYSIRERGSAPIPPVPSGPVIGYVHSHPTTAVLFAPPSADDYPTVLPFATFQIQLVLEMDGRTWGLFDGHLCTWLGTIGSTGVFQPQTDGPTNQRVYRVISGDQIRLERAGIR
jgi:hypothetical protein